MNQNFEITDLYYQHHHICPLPCKITQKYFTRRNDTLKINIMLHQIPLVSGNMHKIFQNFTVSLVSDPVKEIWS